jgi:hypothetical protein
MTEPVAFEVSVAQNEYLPVDGRVMDAVISVSASGPAGEVASVAQVIMIDCSGSMSDGVKLLEAKRAIAVALDTMRDGVAFAIVAGTTTADMVYPRERGMATATAATRAEAKAAVRRLVANGRTRIGTWLELANELLAGQPAQIKHAILLTDGHDTETREDLRRVLETCRGRFVCDSRGVGDSWDAETLLDIADVLLGSAVGLPDPSQLAADFRAITEAVMGKAAAGVALRLRLARGVRVRLLRQVFPRIVELTERGTMVDQRMIDYPTGQWGAETRDFHVSLEVPPGTVDDQVRLATVRMVVDDQQSPEQNILVRWIDDQAQPSPTNTRVAHYTDQTELAATIEQGLAARAEGDLDTATAKLGRAVQLAEQSGHTDTLRLLTKVVDVVGDTPALRTPTVQLDLEMVAVVSRMTVRIRVPSAEQLDLVPIVIYLSREDGHERVEAAVEDMVHRAGWWIAHYDDPIRGSFLRRLWAKSGLTADELAVMAGHRVESELVRRPDADVTAMMLQHVGPVLIALQPTEHAVIWVGAVLIIKVNGVVSVRELTVDQQAWLSARPGLVAAPEALAEALSVEPQHSLDNVALIEDKYPSNTDPAT